MKLLKGIVLLGLVLVFAQCKTDEEVDPKGGGGFSNANYAALSYNGQTRYYTLYVPESYDASQGASLVINYHGFGGEAFAHLEEVGVQFGLHYVAEAGQFIVVYPQGVERDKGAPEWDPGDNGLEDITSNDVFFTQQLIATLASNYSIDTDRVYAIGYSNGGMMAYGLACNLADQIAAVGIMSGVMLEDDCNTDFTTSVIHFHGINDDVLPYTGNSDYQSIDSIVDFWLDHNQIPSSSLNQSNLENGAVLLEEWTGGSEGTAYTLYTINEENGSPGGHVWFSAAIDGRSPNQILWDFLSAFSL